MRTAVVIALIGILLLMALIIVLHGCGNDGRPSAAGEPALLAVQRADPTKLPSLNVNTYCSGAGGKRAAQSASVADPSRCMADEERWLAILKYRFAKGDISDQALKGCQSGLYGLNNSYGVFATCIQLQRHQHTPLSYQD